jgi:hypothetical protein
LEIKVNSPNVSKWFSFATNLAVLGGLMLVAYELNQNSELARTALINDGSGFENELWLGLFGNAPSDVIAKSVECPERMTYADFMVMDAYLFTGINIVYRNYEIAKEGLFSQSDWKSEVDDYVHWYLANPFGRIWWDGSKIYFDTRFSDYVDNQLEKEGIDSFGAWQRLRAKLDFKTALKAPVSESCR